MTPPGHQSRLLMLISRLPASEREREVKILKLTISITDRESDFISTFTDNPPVGEHTVYGHILGLPY